jgi:hypothetical protein
VCVCVSSHFHRRGVFIGPWGSSTDLEKSVWCQVVAGWPSHVADWLEQPPRTFSTALSFYSSCRHVSSKLRIHGYFIHLLDMLVHKIDVLWARTHPPSLKFCSSLSKAKPEAMQEIWDNTGVVPCSNLRNESMWPYLAVPTYLMVLLWIFHLVLSGWKVEPFVRVSPT